MGLAGWSMDGDGAGDCAGDWDGDMADADAGPGGVHSAARGARDAKGATGARGAREVSSVTERGGSTAPTGIAGFTNLSLARRF